MNDKNFSDTKFSDGSDGFDYHIIPPSDNVFLLDDSFSKIAGAKRGLAGQTEAVFTKEEEIDLLDLSSLYETNQERVSGLATIIKLLTMIIMERHCI